MAYPPHFLDELRARVGLTAFIGRRVKLTRKGREHSGLCPFHNEKTPSFTVSDEKNFFHCFGCGAHGDVIGYVMRTENLSFPEAIERLADEAGIPVPVSSPAERETARRQATLYQVMEAACGFFESSLRGAGGREALAYLRDRGLDEDAIARFRLGFAPDSRGALKTALVSDEIDMGQLLEGGLLIKPDDGRDSYDRFRGRVTFPITDRRGRVIAFGARALGDAEPKYLNSPDTPLFHKGQVLYGMAIAWPAARKTNRLVVVEGYMDVIALVRAGIEEAVAPLGTAVTEAQIALLWNMAPEPVLCFDGDTAGARAMGRAAERALPLLKPGNSLRFVTLPSGDDPDTLIATSGAGVFEELLATARPLDQVIWDMESAGHSLDTPERIAGLENRLEQRAFAIEDKKVQYQYLAAFRQRLRDAARSRAANAYRARPHTPGSGGFRGDGRGFGQRGSGRGNAGHSGWGDGRSSPPLAPPEAAVHRREQAVLATILNHFPLLDEFDETIGSLNFSHPALDKLRQEILLLYVRTPDLDSEALERHLMETGYAQVLQDVLSPAVFVSARSARSESDVKMARTGLLELIHGMRLEEAQKRYNEQPTDENFARLQECQLTKVQSLRDSV
ncbi:MAG: DNA primase [Proteobacteria bacterium]|nr:DNA primase [Pseudomonadota bacterium]